MTHVTRGRDQHHGGFGDLPWKWTTDGLKAFAACTHNQVGLGYDFEIAVQPSALTERDRKAFAAQKMVEAGGVEPPSEKRCDTKPTCLAQFHCFRPPRSE